MWIVIFVHLLPYWENVDIRSALKTETGFYNHIQAEFPDKPIVVGEAGWPSDGRTRGAAEASVANEARFMRAFVQSRMEKGWDYYLLEAYDQPRKTHGKKARWAPIGACSMPAAGRNSPSPA